VDLPVAPKGGLSGFVEATLKQGLLEGRLKPGERLVTRDLAVRLGTSLTPVREALLKLVAAGALESAPAQAFTVPVVTARQYAEIADIRRAVEGLAAERAALAMTPACLADLAAANDAYRAARRGHDVTAALRLNQTFRFTLYAAADMPTLFDIIERLWLRIGPSLNFLYPRPDEIDLGRHSYDDVLDALAAGDAATVRRAIERAVEAGTRILLANLDASGDGTGRAGTPPRAVHFP
jgi:GntR family colanic acid and biofilm gene transcriptional regulator